MQMPNTFITRIPHTGSILLIRSSLITIIHIQRCINRTRKTCDIHPSNQPTISAVKQFNLMIQFNTTRICENNIITITLTFQIISKIRIRTKVNENRKVSKSIIYHTVINCYILTVRPIHIPPRSITIQQHWRMIIQ